MKTISKAALLKMGAAILTTLLVMIITQDLIIPITPLNRLEQKFIDYRFQERGEVDFEDSADVVILEITQDSYDQIPPPYNSWPWPRKYFANIVENLNEAGVRAIGIDLVMSNPDKFSPENDSLLFAEIEKYQNVIVAGKIDIKAEAALQGRGSEVLMKNISENYSNIFFEADSSIGIVQAVSDQDGVYRRYVPYVYSQVHNKKLPTFAYAALNKYYNRSSLSTAVKEDDYFVYNDVEIPLYQNTAALINFTFGKVPFGP